MTWSYEDKNLGQGGKDDVRAMIGDDVPASPMVSDETINFFIGNSSSLLTACAGICLALSTKFARLVDQQAGTFRDAYSQASKAYFQKSVWFQTQAASLGTGMPYAGGISITDKVNQEMDTDRKRPEFSLGMMDSGLPVPPVGGETEEDIGTSSGGIAD